MHRAERLAAAGSPVGPYMLQAGIAACHARARRPQDTDWKTILGLYDVLRSLWPNPVVELNRTVAVSMVNGPWPPWLNLTSYPAIRGCAPTAISRRSARTCSSRPASMPPPVTAGCWRPSSPATNANASSTNNTRKKGAALADSGPRRRALGGEDEGLRPPGLDEPCFGDGRRRPAPVDRGVRIAPVAATALRTPYLRRRRACRRCGSAHERPQMTSGRPDRRVALPCPPKTRVRRHATAGEQTTAGERAWTPTPPS